MIDTKRNIALRVSGAASVAALFAALGSTPAQAVETKFYGDVSVAMSLNMKDVIETKDDDKYKISMLRATSHLNMDANLTEGLSFVGKVRLVRDFPNSYLTDLERLGGDSAGHSNLARLYTGTPNYLREAYFDWKLNDRLQFRIGKQQVAWGETDFFQAMDMVHGYDFTWRSILEPANEELRKPLFLINTTVMVPELDGKAQLLLRPGKANRKDAVGNTIDLFGGRWAGQPYKGVDFRVPLVTPYNYSNPEGDAEDTTWGVRWSGSLMEINYSLSYLKTYNPFPVVNPAANMDFLTLIGVPVPAGTPSGSEQFKGRTPIGVSGELIYPKIDLFGLTASGYSSTADAVFSGELAYIRDYAYNFGYISGLSGVFGPGFDGIRQKNVVKSMVRMDKNLAFTQSVLGTEKPAFFSVQLFDTWIRGFKSSENLVQAVGFGQASKKHSSLLTTILGLSYANGTVVPELVAGWYMTYGGGFAVPSVSLQFGKDWRFKVEYDHFWNTGSRPATPPGANAANTERDTSFFGYFNNNDQLYMKLTYQF